MTENHDDEGRPTPPPAEASSQDPAPPREDRPFLPLDPRVVNLWRIQRALGWVVMLFLTMIGVVTIQMAVAQPLIRNAAVGVWLVLLLLAFWFALIYPVLVYGAAGYRIDDRVIEIKGGWLFRSVQLVPLSRLQHVDLQSDPFERLFGLATLALFTAGTQHSSLGIPGLDAAEAARLRDSLVVLGEEDAV